MYSTRQYYSYLGKYSTAETWYRVCFLLETARSCTFKLPCHLVSSRSTADRWYDGQTIHLLTNWAGSGKQGFRNFNWARRMDPGGRQCILWMLRCRQQSTRDPLSYVQYIPGWNQRCTLFNYSLGTWKSRPNRALRTRWLAGLLSLATRTLFIETALWSSKLWCYLDNLFAWGEKASKERIEHNFDKSRSCPHSPRSIDKITWLPGPPQGGFLPIFVRLSHCSRRVSDANKVESQGSIGVY